MTFCRVTGLCWGLLLLVTGSVTAQETRIHIVQSGASNFIADLKDIVALTPDQKLQKQWANINDMLDSFLMGFDAKKPMRVDVIIGKDSAGTVGLNYEPSFPITKLTGKDSFIDNLKSLDFTVKKAKTPDVYEVTAPGNKGAKATPGYLRSVHGHAVIRSTEKAVPANLANPLTEPDVQALLAKGHDLALEMKNDAASMKQRQGDFQSLRKELEAAIKFKRDEDKAEFELRKLTATQTFDEIERFLVESETLFAGWTTAPKAAQGRGVLRLTALPETELLKSIRELAVKPNYFANVTLHDKGTMSGKWMFPLDKMRQEQAKVRHPVFGAAMKAGIDKRPGLNDAGKVAAKEAIDKLVEIFDNSLDIGFEGFLDMHDDGTGKGTQTAVIGARCGKAKLADEIVKLMPKIRDDWSVKLNAVTHGGVSIHELAVPKRRQTEFGALFGGEAILYVGTSEQAVWSACGVNALAELKAAIDDQAKPAPAIPEPAFVSVSMKFGPWVKFLDTVIANEPPIQNPTKQQQTQQKERERLRKLAMEAFAKGEELLSLKLTRDGDAVDGEMSINEGIFKFVGSAIADFSKQNLN